MLRTPGSRATLLGTVGVNPGPPWTDPAWARSGQLWAGNHGGVSALAADGDALLVAADTAEFVPILLRQSHDGTRRAWERGEFQPAQGAAALAVAFGNVIILQNNGRAKVASLSDGRELATWDLLPAGVARDESALFGTGGKVFAPAHVSLAGRGDVLVVAFRKQNLVRWLDAQGKATREARVADARGLAIDRAGRALATVPGRVVELPPTARPGRWSRGWPIRDDSPAMARAATSWCSTAGRPNR